MCKIYSEVISNAEQASRQISKDDPLKKQWYKRVLEYQIKEKNYRDQLAKQERMKADIRHEQRYLSE